METALQEQLAALPDASLLICHGDDDQAAAEELCAALGTGRCVKAGGDGAGTADVVAVLSPALLAAAYALLRPHGKVYVAGGEAADVTLAGFTGAAAVEGAVVVGEKPDWEVGHSASLPRARRSGGKSVKLWEAMAADDDIGGTEELELEDDLDDGLQLARKECGDGSVKRAPCKDCSCGLAERVAESVTIVDVDDAAVVAGAAVTAAPTSSCGSCYKGDAFRCASCPYLGQPAFKPGSKVVLDLSADF
eukprot:PLAT1551.1.p1 GENE.PLAT1551.1~~PLAT1551.1.p1  ORF type:complete len:258 (-),score=91.51 PLAT1551.1:133-879(-)